MFGCRLLGGSVGLRERFVLTQELKLVRGSLTWRCGAGVQLGSEDVQYP